MTPSTEREARVVRNYPSDWSDSDTKAVDTAHVLAVDAVEKAGSGHPGTAMSLAPLAYSPYQCVIRHDPKDAKWAGRDRFILSCGHTSLTQYVQPYPGGFGLELDDLKALRTWDAFTPGHPGYGHTDGVEITTGPLGQGLASAVGFAMTSRRERGLFDPEVAPGESPFDHYVYTIVSDSDVQEGVTAGACSLADTQQPGNLIIFWDDNGISIENGTIIAFTENVTDRYRAYGWQVIEADGGEDVAALEAAVEEARKDIERLTFIRVHTMIAYPASTEMNTGASHGAALGGEEIVGIKEALGFDTDKSFDVADEVIEHTRKLAERGAEVHVQWQVKFDEWVAVNPERKALLDRLTAGELPEDFDAELSTWEPGEKGVATRKVSETALQALDKTLPELWGGSADLAGSNNIILKDEPSFGLKSITTGTRNTDPYGHNLHFGIREHAMGSILNGILLYGGTRPYDGTFLIFSDYMRPAVRLASPMGISPIYVWTHDSIGLGENGPTYQPVEQLALLRAIPDVSTVRPADANETAQAWSVAPQGEAGPEALALTRQNVPVLEGTKEKAAEGVRRSAYMLVNGARETPDVTLMGTGSEVYLAVKAAEKLAKEDVSARVVSVPCLDWLEQQDEAYREQILPKAVRARVSVEAGIIMPRYRHLSDAGRAVSLEHLGASASYKELFEKFGITASAVVDAVKESIEATK